MTDNPTQSEKLEPQPPERIWINTPTEVTEHDQCWWYDHSMAFPTVEYVRADLVSRAPVVAPQGNGSLLSSEVALKIARHIKGKNAGYFSYRDGLAELEAIINEHFVNAALAPSSSPVPPEQKIDFSCRVCGVQCDIAPDPPARAVCPEHCEDHDYRYERSERGTYCVHCGQQAPEDWYDD